MKCSVPFDVNGVVSCTDVKTSSFASINAYLSVAGVPIGTIIATVM